MAVNCWAVPSGIEAFAGVAAIDTRVAVAARLGFELVMANKIARRKILAKRSALGDFNKERMIDMQQSHTFRRLVLLFCRFSFGPIN